MPALTGWVFGYPPQLPGLPPRRRAAGATEKKRVKYKIETKFETIYLC